MNKDILYGDTSLIGNRKDGIIFIEDKLSKIKQDDYCCGNKCGRLICSMIFGLLSLIFMYLSYNSYYYYYASYYESCNSCVLNNAYITINPDPKHYPYSVNIIIQLNKQNYTFSDIHVCNSKDFCLDIVNEKYQKGSIIKCYIDEIFNIVSLNSAEYESYLPYAILYTIITLVLFIPFVTSFILSSYKEDYNYYSSLKKKFYEP